MNARGRSVVELVVAVLAAVGAVFSWSAARSQVDVAPVLDGEPVTTSWVYYPPMITLALVLATVAGVLVVLAVARLRHRTPTAT